MFPSCANIKTLFKAVAFVITAPENGVMARKRDRMLKRQLEREEELRRKKLDFEELKRNQEKGIWKKLYLG